MNPKMQEIRNHFQAFQESVATIERETIRELSVGLDIPEDVIRKVWEDEKRLQREATSERSYIRPQLVVLGVAGT